MTRIIINVDCKSDITIDWDSISSTTEIVIFAAETARIIALK
jgi:hypothetical protein